MKIIRPIPITDAILSASSIAETDYAAWSGATTYAAGDRVIVVATHRVYESLQAANLNHDPTTDSTTTPVWWVVVGSTNRWRMFDDSPSLQSSAATSISATLTPGERVNSIALLNLSAATVQVTVTDPVDGVVYDTLYDLSSPTGIDDWYSYFFEPIARKTDMVLTDLPPYSAADIDIVISEPTGTAAVGEVVIGLYRDIGGTQFGAQLGIQDYSVKQRDDFGNYTILERAFNRRGVFSVWMDAGMVSAAHALLSDLRATPAVYVGADDYDAAIIYGFFKDFSIDITFSNASVCSIELEGLI